MNKSSIRGPTDKMQILCAKRLPKTSVYEIVSLSGEITGNRS